MCKIWVCVVICDETMMKLSMKNVLKKPQHSPNWCNKMYYITCGFRFNKSKQKDELLCLQGSHFFVHFVLQFFFVFLLSKWSKFPLNVQLKSNYSCIQLISIGALSFKQQVVLTDYRLPECKKKKHLRSNQRGFANIQKVPLHLLLYYSHEILHLWSCKKERKKKGRKEKKKEKSLETGRHNISTLLCVCV